MPPHVTIVTAVYNGEAYLHEAVQSIIGQTFGDFEYLIVDDASTDGTKGILELHEKNDSRVRVITNTKNMGRALSRNRGLQEARGEYIAILDADDIALERRVEREVEYLHTHPEVGVVGTWFDVIDDNGEFVITRRLPVEPQEVAARDLEIPPFCHPSVMFRKECIQKVGSYREEFVYAQDYDLLLRILEHYKGANIPEVLTRYRMNPDSCSQRHSVLQHRFGELACRLARERRESGLDVIQRGETGEVEALLVDVMRLSWLAARRGVADTCVSWAMRFFYADDSRRARRFILRAIWNNPAVCVSHADILVKTCMPVGFRRAWKRMLTQDTA